MHREHILVQFNSHDYRLSDFWQSQKLCIYWNFKLRFEKEKYKGLIKSMWHKNSDWLLSASGMSSRSWCWSYCCVLLSLGDLRAWVRGCLSLWYMLSTHGSYWVIGVRKKYRMNLTNCLTRFLLRGDHHYKKGFHEKKYCFLCHTSSLHHLNLHCQRCHSGQGSRAEWTVNHELLKLLTVTFLFLPYVTKYTIIERKKLE